MTRHDTMTSRNFPWSCDNFAVLADASSTGAVMLGKNSDRPVYDSQPLVQVPRRKHRAGESYSWHM